ncbi:coiled-coil domain-containing protein 18-like isoform X1 [Erpetoichthys calabaricus]|uniref:Coiled-coil domain containing 18 n=1 Tax=Erpetoichthys calabaricus TaxID=27687 RepID=A0A8C4XFT7_ERPCA|nr:coiled-coil domain-containing protein 18-like isoform X1 [Erpetoichthys calabaricus]
MSDPEENLLVNVLALRKCLMKTEKSLQNIQEELVDGSNSASVKSSVCNDPVALTLEDLQRPDERETLSFHPRFTSTSRMSDSNPRARSGFSTSLKMLEIENEKLKRKLSTICEENSSLVAENDWLKAEMDSLQSELSNSKSKICYLESNYEAKVSNVPDLKEHIISLEAEVNAQENALRDAERKLEQSQLTVLATERVVDKLKEELKRVKSECAEKTWQAKRTEQQRNEALYNAEKLTVALQQCKENFSDKLKKVLGSENTCKESLAQCNHERQQVERKYLTLETEIDQLRQQMRQLKEDISKENTAKSQLESEKNKTLSLLEDAKQTISRLEKELIDKENIIKENNCLKNENEELQSTSNDLKEKLIRFEQKMVENQDELTSLESILHQFSLKENIGIKTYEKKESQNLESFVHDLRMQLELKEGEIKKLQTEITSYKMNDHLSPENHENGQYSHFEKTGERKYHQMLPLILGLKEDKKKLEDLVQMFRKKQAEAEVKISSLETRMAQRTTQFQQIQDELLDKAAESVKLEKEVKKKESQISSLEAQLEEKISLYSTTAIRIADLEEELEGKNNHIHFLEVSLGKEKQEALQTRENLKKAHMDKYTELENQVDMLQSDLEHKQLQLRDQERRLAALQHECLTNQQQAESLESALTVARQELEKATKCNKEALKEFQNQATDSANKIRYLEAALTTCDNELKCCIQRAEEDKNLFEKQLKRKCEEVQQLQKELKCSIETLQETSEQNMRLQQMLEEQQLMLQQSTTRVGELEDHQSELQKMISSLEQELQKQKTATKDQLRTVDEHLQTARRDIEYKDLQISELMETARQVKMERNNDKEELNKMEKEMLRLRNDSSSQAIQLSQLEVNLQETKEQLEKKSDLVIDLEEQLHRSEADRRNSLQRTQEFEDQLKTVRGELMDTIQQLQQLQDALQQCQLSTEEKDLTIQKLSAELRDCKNELDDRNNELLDMDQALKERQWELKQRAVQLTKLDLTIREHQAEMEEKLCQLEGALAKSKQELTERNKQIEILVDKLKIAEEELQQKDDFEKQAVEHRQQVRLAREQLQQVHRELAEARKEGERLAEELNETIQISHEKEARANRLAEDLGVAHARCSQIEARMKAKIEKLQGDYFHHKEAHKREILGLQENQTSSLASSGTLSTNLKNTQEYLKEKLQQRERDLEEAEGNILHLQAELQERDDVIQAGKEALLIKKSEVARLQAKISSYERAMRMKDCSFHHLLKSDADRKDSTLRSCSSLREKLKTCSWSNAESVDLERDIEDSLDNSPIQPLKLSGECCSESDISLAGVGLQDESSFNPLTYKVDNNISDFMSDKSDLDSLSGMLKFISEEVSAKSQSLRKSSSLASLKSVHEQQNNKTEDPFSSCFNNCRK